VAEARHAGRAEGKAEMTVLLAQAAKQAAALRMAHGERAIELAVQIAEKILAEQLSLEPERVLRVAQRALKSVCWCRAIVVRAHPADVAVMEKNRATLVKELSELNEIEIVADARQTRGGCIVESEIGEIDATLDTQLDALQKALLGEAAS
jgi:flagellar biosynthesis/type III secretory pathway protein FliH